jgi:hypothetical protein
VQGDCKATQVPDVTAEPESDLQQSSELQRKVSSGLLRRVALVRTDVSRVTKIGELGTTQAATSSRCTLRRNTKY